MNINIDDIICPECGHLTSHHKYTVCLSTVKVHGEYEACRCSLSRDEIITNFINNKREVL